MKVTIVFDFPEITDPNSDLASVVIEGLTSSSVEWQSELRQSLADDRVAVYVDDAQGDLI